VPESPESLTLRDAEERDLGLVWVWANDPATREASLDPTPISYAEHTGWFRDELAAPDRRLWIAEQAGEPVAVVRLTGLGGDEPEVHIHVAPAARGRGLGRAALEAAAAGARKLGEKTIFASIKPDNAASRRAFEAVGFAAQGERMQRGVRVIWYRLGP
jgi:RimJ/RimL family protein N-acetyltransferase